MSEGGKIRAGNTTVEVSRADKVLFPGAGVTKMDLAEYYLEIAPVALPYIKDRPVTMHRYPDGIDGESFYQKEAPDYFPGWIDRVEVRIEGGKQEQVMANDAAALVYLADQGCITPHVWLSRAGDLDRPDRMIFDLDPSKDDFAGVRKGARILRGILDDIGLVPFVMTSGSRGLHVVVPLDRGAGFDEVRSLVSGIARLAAGRNPGLLTVEARKNKRKGRILIDYMRNAYAQTSVPPYCVRAREGAPVSAPIEWDELGRSGLTPKSYDIRGILRRLGQKDDPWKGMMRRARSIDGPRDKLERMSEKES